MKEGFLVEEISLGEFLENKPRMESCLVADTKDSPPKPPFELSLDEP